jgi:hypothetical protein
MRPHSRKSLSLLACTAALVLVASGCAVRIGPKTVARDRYDYSQSLSQSWQQQMLLNLVRVRYLDAPFFLDIAQVVAQYSMTVGAGATGGATGSTGAIAGTADAHWVESPTITYSPLTGEKFTKSLLQPVPPVMLFSLAQASWPIDSVVRIGVRSINGVHAGTRMGLAKRGADPEFPELLHALHQLQEHDAIGLRVAGGQGFVVLRSSENDTGADASIAAFKRLLGLNPNINEFAIAYGTVAPTGKEIAILTRSMLEILYETAAGVEVPPSDIQEKRATKPRILGDEQEPGQLRVTVHSSKSKPAVNVAATAVEYRDTWFWIADDDLPSKGGLSFLLTMFTLAASGDIAAPPVLTISRP